MPEDDLSVLFDNSREPVIPPEYLRLVIRVDFDEIRFVRFETPRGLVLTFQDFSHALQNRLRGILRALQELRVECLDYHSGRKDQALADKHPVDLRLYRENENFEELFGLVVWWINRDLRKLRFIKDSYHNDKQVHTTWTCECGNTVDAEKEKCDNAQCPSGINFRLCMGEESHKKHLRRA